MTFTFLIIGYLCNTPDQVCDDGQVEGGRVGQDEVRGQQAGQAVPLTTVRLEGLVRLSTLC